MNKEINGYKWSFINVVIKSIAQLAYSAIISRILDQNVFGIVAMATLVVNFGSYFAKVGLGPAIIQKKDINDDEINAAFTSSVLLGLVCCIIFYFSAPIVGWFFETSRVVPFVRALSLSFFVTGFNITPMALLSRDIKFKEISRIEISAYIIGNIIVGIGCAILGGQEWSLVLATLTQQAIISIGSIIIVKRKYKFIFKKEAYVGLYSYGIKSTANNLLDYFVANIEKFFLGKMDGNALGAYNRTNSIIVMPFEQITLSLSRVFFPQISKIQVAKNKLREVYKDYYMLFTTIICSLGLGAFAASNNLISIVLGKKWLKVVGMENMLRIVIIATILQYITHFNAVLCDATAQLNAKFKIQSINLIFTVLGCFLFFKKGVFSVLVVMLMSKVLKFVMYQYNTSKILEYSLKENVFIFGNILKSSCIPAILIFIIRIISNIVNINSLVVFLIQLLVGACGLIIGVLILPIEEFIKKIKIEVQKYEKKWLNS